MTKVNDRTRTPQATPQMGYYDTPSVVIMVFGKRRGRLVVEVALVEVEIVVVGIIVEVVD